MINNEAKLLIQNEDAKVQGLFKSPDLVSNQVTAQGALNAQGAPTAPNPPIPQNPNPAAPAAPNY